MYLLLLVPSTCVCPRFATTLSLVPVPSGITATLIRGAIWVKRVVRDDLVPCPPSSSSGTSTTLWPRPKSSTTAAFHFKFCPLQVSNGRRISGKAPKSGPSPLQNRIRFSSRETVRFSAKFASYCNNNSSAARPRPHNSRGVRRASAAPSPGTYLARNVRNCAARRGGPRNWNDKGPARTTPCLAPAHKSGNRLSPAKDEVMLYANLFPLES